MAFASMNGLDIVVTASMPDDTMEAQNRMLKAAYHSEKKLGSMERSQRDEAWARISELEALLRDVRESDLSKGTDACFCEECNNLRNRIDAALPAQKDAA